MGAAGFYLANLFTAIRFALSPIIPFSVYNEVNPIGMVWDLPFATGVLFFAIGIALTDAVDGFIAKKLGGVSKFGMEFDPLADKVFYTMLFVTLYTWHGLTWRSAEAFGLPTLVAFGYAVDMTRLRIQKRILAARPAAKLKAIVQGVALIALFGPFVPELPLWGAVSLPWWWEPVSITGLWLSMFLMIIAWLDYYRHQIIRIG